MYNWDWGWVWTYRLALLEATWLTIWLNIIILAIGSIVGVLIGLMRRSKIAILRIISIAYIDIFRALPILVLLVWFFFCVPILLGGIRLSPIISSIIVLSLNLSAFVAEIFRSGVDNVPIHHIESAKACGLNRTQMMRHVIFPIAIRSMFPPLVGQYINSIKLSVLASVIAVPELLQKTTDIISQTYRPLEFYTILALIFLVILLPGTVLSRKLESGTYMKWGSLKRI